MRHRVAGVRHPQQETRVRLGRRAAAGPCLVGEGRRETPRRALHQSPPSASRPLGPRASVLDDRALGLLNGLGAVGTAGSRERTWSNVGVMSPLQHAEFPMLGRAPCGPPSALAPSSILGAFLIQRTWNRRSAGGGPPRACGAIRWATKGAKGVGVASRMRQRARAHCGRCRPSAAPVRTLEVDDRFGSGRAPMGARPLSPPPPVGRL